MGLVILAWGESRQGKSFLSKRLREESKFASFSTDDLYYNFMQNHCPELYFKALNIFIGPHYETFVKHYRDYARIHLHRDFYAEWTEFLLNVIESESKRAEKVVFEGYQLNDHRANLEAKLPAIDGVTLLSIQVVDKTYRCNGLPISFEQIINGQVPKQHKTH